MKTMLHSMMALAMLSLVACSSSPTASKTQSEMDAGTKTGMVKNIVITDTVTPPSLTAHAGDEVRWINQRKESVIVGTARSKARSIIGCPAGTDSRKPWAWASITPPHWRATKQPGFASLASAPLTTQCGPYPMTKAA